MLDRSKRFLELSVWLTGFAALQLRATGMLVTYLDVLDSHLPRPVVDRLFAGAGDDETLDDAALGPVARNVIIMWYSGAWPPLPDTWTTATGIKDTGATGVISAASYQAGLQWTVANAHPAAARQQGFGAWAFPPTPFIPGAGVP